MQEYFNNSRTYVLPAHYGEKSKAQHNDSAMDVDYLVKGKNRSKGGKSDGKGKTEKGGKSGGKGKDEKARARMVLPRQPLPDIVAIARSGATSRGTATATR